MVPGLTRCSGSRHAFDYIDEPAVTFTGDGGLIVSGGLFMADGSDSAGLSVRSDDGGVTWSAPAVIARDRDQGGVVTAPVVVDPRDPRLMYAVATRFPAAARSRNEAQLVRSTDGGRTWSEPVRVNRTPTGIPAGNQQAFTVTVDVAGDGTVGVSHSDFRHNDGAAPLLTDRWLVRCRPRAAATCYDSTPWKETRLTPRSFDMRQAPRIPDASSPRGYFLGEQMGLAAGRRGFTAAWAAPDSPGSAAIYTRSVG